MSSNVGLSTPRGSGTSGYVQRNLSLLKPRSAGAGAPYTLDSRGPKTRKPDQAILTHDRLREIEVRVLELRDRLEDEGKLDDDKIDEECETLRKALIEEMERGDRNGKADGKGKGKGIKGYQVHELAEAKAVESERLRRALGLKEDSGRSGSGKEGEEDSEHPMARQERRKREREAERAGREEGERDERLRQRARSRSRSP